MTQEQWLTLLLKISLISGICSVALWIGVYTRLARWWRNPIGRALVLMKILVALLLVPSTLSLFLHFNRRTSNVAAWIDTAFITSITPLMIWRTVIWLRFHQRDKGGGSHDAPAR